MKQSDDIKGLLRRLEVLCDIGKPWNALAELPPAAPGDQRPHGYRMIIESRIVHDFLAEPGLLKQRARETSEFRANFADFPLDGTEGYLLSLIEGGLSVEQVLLASTLGRFQTLLSLARLRQKGVVVFLEVGEDTRIGRGRRGRR